MFIELKCKETAWVGRERYRGSAHELGEHRGGALRVSCSNREMMDHGFLLHRIPAE
jgi:hypothetical protein